MKKGIEQRSQVFGALVRQFQNGSYAMPTGMTVSALCSWWTALACELRFVLFVQSNTVDIFVVKSHRQTFQQLVVETLRRFVETEPLRERHLHAVKLHRVGQG